MRAALRKKHTTQNYVCFFKTRFPTYDWVPSRKWATNTTTVSQIRCCSVPFGMSRFPNKSMHVPLHFKSNYANRYIKNIFKTSHNNNKTINFVKNTNILKPTQNTLIVCIYIYEKMSNCLKCKGSQKSSYFNCWASLPSPAFFQRRRAFFLRCPTARASASPPLRSALSASKAALPTSHDNFVMTSWWFGACAELWNCRFVCCINVPARKPSLLLGS